jgi:hypothetical protein
MWQNKEALQWNVDCRKDYCYGLEVLIPVYFVSKLYHWLSLAGKPGTNK